MDDNLSYTPHPDYSLLYLSAFIFWILLSGVAAQIAKNKGNSALQAIIVSVFFSPLIGIILALAAETNKGGLESKALKSGEIKKCLFCAELIKKEANTCRYCGREQSIPARPRIESSSILSSPRIVRPKAVAGKFLVARDGKEFAELDITSIKTLISTYELSREDHYFDSNTNSWIQLRQHPQLSS